MTWINPLDRLPQIPQDYANHIAYGGVMGFGLLVLGFNEQNALMISLAVSAAKKIVDYFKEAEGWKMCTAKTVVTIIFPFAFYIHTLM